MTNWDYYEAVKRFQRVLEVSGINAAGGGAACCVLCFCSVGKDIARVTSAGTAVLAHFTQMC
jgi:hypothetical protein